MWEVIQRFVMHPQSSSTCASGLPKGAAAPAVMRLLWPHTLCIAALMMLTACALQPRAMLGSADAQYRLGLKYLVADPPEYEKAAYWLQRAAVEGNIQAQKQLGRFYVLGWGGAPDLVRAYLWLQLAAVLDPQADYERRILARHMSREQIDRAQNLAAQYQRGKVPDAELESVEHQAAPTKTEPDDSLDSPQPTRKDASAGGHYIELGAFAHPKKGDRLQARLHALGEPTTAESVRRDGRDLTVVRAGPYADAASARAALERLERHKTKLGIAGKITPVSARATAPAAPTSAR